jgi:MoaA/NifB/PqqE/SkfB family radical SAM enzyme|tara:strand:+ start:2245 stop:3474 length:1230 start_codon:yes stop_codon:yes gene_type:complete
MKKNPIHDFTSKLIQSEVIENLKNYVRWQQDLRKSSEPSTLFEKVPDHAPISINLDLTTACNYACDHCVDIDILNTGIRFEYEKLEKSIDQMAKKGLKSVIIIGGGEPTVDPKFTTIVPFLKKRNIQVAIVSNGSRMDRLLDVSHYLDENDWIRLSLDSGRNETFQAMHKPKGKGITLEEICSGVAPIRKKNSKLKMGFSFIVTWKGATNKDINIVENINEIQEAAQLARDSDFTYFSIKPFLVRSETNNAEIVGIDEYTKNYFDVIKQIRISIGKIKKLETSTFSVIESTNLSALESGDYKKFTNQPKNCHFTFFRQVLSPLGVYNCPVYRHVGIAKLSENDGYSTQDSYQETNNNVGKHIYEFDASENCKNVTCLYNSTNWFIEDLISNPNKLENLMPIEDEMDFYL